MNMNFQEAKASRDNLEKICKDFSDYLNTFPRMENGLHSDEVKALPEFQRAKKEHAIVFQALRKFNAEFVKVFKKEIREERRSKHDKIY